MNTKDLFELAQIMSDAYDDSGIDRTDVVAWADLDPAEQAAYAEGIRAVVEELQRRGWGYHPQKFILGIPEINDGDPVTPAEYYMPSQWLRPWRFPHIEFPTPDYGVILNDGSLRVGGLETVPDLPEALEKIEELVEVAEKLIAPRSWGHLRDIPPNTLTTDREGDFWETDSAGTLYLRISDEDEGSKITPNDSDSEEYGPFTEVVESETWNRWQDVPDGVKYSGVNDETEPAESYENRNGVRWNVTHGYDYFESVYNDAEMEIIAPFKRVG
ncbi:hypothetical protein ACWCPQ_14335 [Nocardia sp. NPDC001965]